jgi:uncharacterized protein YkwD
VTASGLSRWSSSRAVWNGHAVATGTGDYSEMRKPLLVVCGVTAAVLIAGGIVATTAGADEAPDGPSAPAVALPDIAGLPQLPGDGADAADVPPGGGGQTGGNPATVGQTGADLPGADLPGADLPGADLPGGDQAGGHQAGGGDQARPGAGQGGDGQHGDLSSPGLDGPAQDGNGAQHADTQDATPHRPGGQDTANRDNAGLGHVTRDGAGHAALQKPAATLAAAQREVSPSSVSTSPGAPVQQQVLALVNENRRRGGCGDLTLDRRLIAAAYGHAADMARRGYFAHESMNGEGAGERVQDAGYRWSRYGENIARGPSSPFEVVDGWMHSPVHRENIMDCQLHQMGIGLAFSGDRETYWVQDFGTPSA